MEWISVEKSLPTIPDGKAAGGCVQVKVLAWNGEDWQEAWYQPDTNEFYDIPGYLGWPIKGVTHWMIPKLPSKEDER